MTNYILREESGAETTIEAEDFADARKQAKEWVLGGTYDNIKSTVWVGCRITDVAAECTDRISVAIDPEEPRCTHDEGHKWCESDVLGHGGGVITKEACAHCRCTKTVDTWATDPSTGEQGLCSIRYGWRDDDAVTE